MSAIHTCTHGFLSGTRVGREYCMGCAEEDADQRKNVERRGRRYDKTGSSPARRSATVQDRRGEAWEHGGRFSVQQTFAGDFNPGEVERIFADDDLFSDPLGTWLDRVLEFLLGLVDGVFSWFEDLLR